VPYFARRHHDYLGKVLVSRCDKPLIELYEFGKTKETHFSKLSQQFVSSEILALGEKLRALEPELPYHKWRLRKMFIEQEITRKRCQAKLKIADGRVS
jgi:hypothetical protein